MRYLLMAGLLMALLGCKNEYVDIEYRGDIGWLTIRSDSGENLVTDKLNTPSSVYIGSTNAYEAKNGDVVAYRIRFSLPVEHEGVGYSSEQWLAKITDTDQAYWQYNREEELYYYESKTFDEYAEVYVIDNTVGTEQDLSIGFTMKYAKPMAYKEVL